MILKHKFNKKHDTTSLILLKKYDKVKNHMCYIRVNICDVATLIFFQTK